jgi:hypothetical protein
MEERKKEQECKISEWGIECQQTHKEERKNEQECKISDWGIEYQQTHKDLLIFLSNSYHIFNTLIGIL